MASDEAFSHELDGFLGSGLLEFPQVNLSIEQDCGDIQTDLALDILPADTLFTVTKVDHTPIGETSSSSGNDNEQPDSVERELLRHRETKRRRIYRQRLKDERDELRHEAEELGMALAKLKRKVLHRNVANEQTVILVDRGSEGGVDAWKAVAMWELESLRRAQAEQKRLQSAIAVRKKLVKDLRKLIFKRVASKTLGESPSTLLRTQSPDAALYVAYLRELDVNRGRIDDVFHTSGVQTMAEGAINWTNKNPVGNNVSQFLHASKSLHPFNFHRMCENFWRLARMNNRLQDREVYEGVKDPSNTLAIKYRVSKAFNGGIVSLRQRLIQRRYCEANSMVMVWKLFVEGEGTFQGMHSVETGWCRLRPAISGEGTWMEMHIRRAPMHYATARQIPDVAKQFNEALEEAINEDQRTFFQALKRAMLRDENC